MEQAIRDLLRDPAISIPLLCFVLALVAMVAGSIRAWINGTFHWPAFSAWGRDFGQVVLITIGLWFGKFVGLFLPEAGTEIGGIDIGPIIAAVAGPAIFLPTLALAGTFIASKVASIKDSLQPPDPAPLGAKFERAIELGDPIPTA